MYRTVDDVLGEGDVSETVGVAFRLRNRADPGGMAPRLCTVRVKGGPGVETYDRNDGTRADTAGLPGSDADGVVYAPDGHAVSYVLVCVCTTESDADCSGCSDPSLMQGSNGTPEESKGPSNPDGPETPGGSRGGPPDRGGPAAASPRGDQ